MSNAPEKYKVDVHLVDEDARTFSTTEGAFMEAIVDADVAAYDNYFQKELKNEPLTKGEKATIKTYLYYQLVHKKKTADAAG